MMIKRRKRRVPGLNTTSTADISFILLVFFLVISSMDSNKGLSRQLPPPDKDRVDQTTELNTHNVLDISIATDGTMSVDGKQVEQERLAERVGRFLEECPNISSHVINVKMKPDTRYDSYFHVENAIAEAYSAQRNKLARSSMGKPYARCTAEQRRKIDAMCPQRVTESVEANQ